MFGWKNSLGLQPRRARGFYIIIAGATLLGVLGATSSINPITRLVSSAVFNGIVAFPLMIGMMLVVTNTAIMGKFAASRTLAIFGWLATSLMAAVMVAFSLRSRANLAAELC
jgi:Mn2+/Fe2+ NRAMP family transporter